MLPDGFPLHAKSWNQIMQQQHRFASESNTAISCCYFPLYNQCSVWKHSGEHLINIIFFHNVYEQSRNCFGCLGSTGRKPETRLRAYKMSKPDTSRGSQSHKQLCFTTQTISFILRGEESCVALCNKMLWNDWYQLRPGVINTGLSCVQEMYTSQGRTCPPNLKK